MAGNVIIITHVFPNHLEPTGGLFNKYQIEEAGKFCCIKVIAPLPWFPGISVLGKRAEFSYAGRVQRKEMIGNIPVYHPLYFAIPKIGRFLHGFFYFFSIILLCQRLHKENSIEAIVSMYGYPDAFAGSLVALFLRKPHIIKLLGSDVNIISRKFLRGKFIRFALRRADEIIVMSDDMKEKVVELGVNSSKLTTLYNGVDKTIFKPISQDSARRKLGIEGEDMVVLFVGNFKRIKGIDFLLEAAKKLKADFPKLKFFLVGQGPLEYSYKNFVKKNRLDKTVKFLGVKTPEEIAMLMNGADILCLPSLNEGLPNVVLESISCGTPVIASNVGGIAEVICSDESGFLIKPGNTDSLVNALKRGLTKEWDRKEIFKRSSDFSWVRNAEGLYEIIKKTSKR
ncbi:MAG: glycosyltransferase family 4 protein [Candidatus Omnitrophota bacterium]